MEGFPAGSSSSARSGKAERLKIAFVVGVMGLLLLAAVAVLMRKSSPEPQAGAPPAMSDSFSRPDPAPLEAPPSSREVRSHMLMPTMGEEAQDKAAAGKTPAPSEKAESAEDYPQDEEPAREAEPKTGTAERARPKLNERGMDTGSKTRSFGSPGGGVGQSAEGGERKAAAAASRGMEVPAQPAATPGAQAGTKSRLRSMSGTGAPEAANSRRIQPFQKDPKGERQSDDSTIRPGWVQMDNGQYIQVIGISDGGKDGGGTSPGGTIGGSRDGAAPKMGDILKH